MKTNVAAYITAALILAGCSSGGGTVPTTARTTAASSAQITVAYHVTTLGGLGGVASANSIAFNGMVSGTANLSGDTIARAALWHGTTAQNLGTLGGDNSAIAWPNHNVTSVAGIAETAAIDPLGENWSCAPFFASGVPTHHVCFGFVSDGQTMRPLPTLGGVNGYAAGANNRGDVVGWAETPLHDATCNAPQMLQFRAAVWDRRGHATALPAFGSDPDSAATAINDRGQIAGISGICDNAVGRYSAIHAVLWQGGTVTDLGNLGGTAWNTPTSINELGHVVGFADLPGSGGHLHPHAFLWTPQRGIRDLGTLPGDTYSYATGINDLDQVVGFSYSATTLRAFIWQNGTMRDLNGSVTSSGSPYLLYANDINDAGVIAGQAYDAASNTTPAFVATPSGITVTSAHATALPQAVVTRMQARALRGLPRP